MKDFFYNMAGEIFGSGLFEGIGEFLSSNPSTGTYANVWDMAANIYDGICVPVATILVLIYFFSNLIERSMQQQSLDVEHVIKALLKMLCGIYFIEHGFEIMASLYGLGLTFLNQIAPLNGGETIYGEEASKAAFKAVFDEDYTTDDWSVLDSLRAPMQALKLFIPWLCTLAMKAVAWFVALTRLIEFYIKTAMAPIALSDFFTEGMHGNGWRFLKGYLATALQGGVVMLAIVLYSVLSTGFLDATFDADFNYMDFIIRYLALGFATIGLMLKSLSLTKEIVGAN